MTTPLTKLTVLFLFALLSCTDNKTAPVAASADTTNNSIVQKPDTTNRMSSMPVTIPDSIKRFTVDDYPLTDDMLGSGDNGREIKSGDIFATDKVWFTNDNLQQTIVVELYTDNFRVAAFHFQNKDIPKALIKRMEMHTGDGNLASQQQKEKNFKGFINAATKINKKFFTTNKEFNLGDSRQKAIHVYGTPDRKTKEDNLEVLEWDFAGDLLYDGKADLKGKPLAKDNYGHQTIMFFRNNKLIAIIFKNDIP